MPTKSTGTKSSAKEIWWGCTYRVIRIDKTVRCITAIISSEER